MQLDFNVVSDEYFQTIGLPILRGRAFSADDREGAPRVAIVNEQMARRFWPEEDPLGKRFQLAQQGQTLEIVGVVRDGKFRNYRAPINACFYVPFSQMYMSGMNLEVRTSGSAMGLVAPVRREVQALDKELRVNQVWTLKSLRDAGLGQERLSAVLLTVFGVLAMALAAIGLYGVLAFTVAQRTHEIGVRMALGAERRDVLRLILGQGLKLTLIGVGAGVVGALMVARLVSRFLYGVEPTDPLTFIIVSLLLTVVALAACYIPARRATKVGPMVALRYE